MVTRYDIIEFQKRAAYFAEDAMATLAELCLSATSEGVRVRAAAELLDRAYGKPTQPVEMAGKNGGPIQTEDLTDRKALIDEARRLGISIESLGLPGSVSEDG